ncbi:hypothetical protein Nepgr_028265 [Nepenthes gracilis]|uniref:Uncharacterized protein n=1 Tax=Nepenthes gracilis TaxID=150966 RepID=A0AAD3TBN0_NEPGR|nr:hypothetical protein Nepgr_028265 [Nepenthes gracilis]
MERFHRNKLVTSTSNVTSMIDRSSDDKLVSSNRAQKGREQITKGYNFQNLYDSSSCRYSVTPEDDLDTLHLRQSTSGWPTVTVMKKLLEDEILTDIKSKKQSSNVIAKLMGLDELSPQKNANKQQKRISMEPQQKRFHRSNKSYGNQSLRKSSNEKKQAKDVYEVIESSKVESSHHPSQVALGRKHSKDEMAFLRQKFVDAKSLSTDKKFHDSIKFDDALEVLASRKNLLLKFLQQPDPLFAKHLNELCRDCEFHYGHARSMKSSALKHNINVKSSGTIDISFYQKHQDALQNCSCHGRVSDSCKLSNIPAVGKEDATAIPTRIVVLKPNLAKMWNISKNASSANCSRDLLSDVWSRKSDGVDISAPSSLESRELAAEITQRMRNKLEATTVISQTPFHWSRWGNISASYCTESSVDTEAKRRLSERWKMAHWSQEVGMGRSTLAEMIAIPDVNIRSSNLGTSISRDGSFARFNGNDGQAGSIGPSVSRSMSLPAFNYLGTLKTGMRHEAFGTARFRVSNECVSRRRNKAIQRGFNSKERSFSGIARQKSICHIDHDIKDMQELQHKRNKRKSSLEEMDLADVKAVILEASTGNLDTNMTLDAMVDLEHENLPKFLSRPDEQINSMEFSGDKLEKDKYCSNHMHESMPQEPSRICLMEGLTCSHFPATQPKFPTIIKESNQPSPVSLLEAPFTEDFSSGSECFDRVSAELHELRMQLQLLKRESEPSYNGPAIISFHEDVEEAPNWFSMERRLLGAEESWGTSYSIDMLTYLGFDDTNPEMFMATWHSAEFPVAPWVFEKLEKKYSGLTTCSRSERRLLFDRINSGIIDIFDRSLDPQPWVSVPMRSAHPSWQNVRFESELLKLSFGLTPLDKSVEIISATAHDINIHLPGYDQLTVEDADHFSCISSSIKPPVMHQRSASAEPNSLLFITA